MWVSNLFTMAPIAIRRRFKNDRHFRPGFLTRTAGITRLCGVFRRPQQKHARQAGGRLGGQWREKEGEKQRREPANFQTSSGPPPIGAA